MDPFSVLRTPFLAVGRVSAASSLQFSHGKPGRQGESAQQLLNNDTEMDELQLIASAIVDETKSHRLPDSRLLYSALFESHDQTRGTFNGFLVSDLEKCIKAVLSRTPSEQKAAAYNRIASEENLDAVSPDDDDLDIWIFESFINPSLDELVQQHKMAN